MNELWAAKKVEGEVGKFIVHLRNDEVTIET